MREGGGLVELAVVVKAEMLDRVLFFDGSSVQVDLEELQGGGRRLRLYVYASTDGDEWPFWRDCDTLDEALAHMRPFYAECQAKW